MRTIVRACMFGLGLLTFYATYSQQVAKTIPYAASPDGLIGFLEFRPADYGSQKHPLIIFLHGIGERGNGTSQINTVAANGTPYLCAHGATMRFTVNGQTSSFVVLSPQLSSQYGYWPTYYVKQMIAYAKANLQIDPNRIYITGLSLGGGGTWRAITETNTENFDYSFDGGIAAAAPVCGTQEMNDGYFCRTVSANHLPIWAFHSVDDGTVSVNATQHGELDAQNCGLTPAAKFTYYQSGGHSGAWINAYDTGHITRTVNGGGNFTANPNLYEWFLSNTRSATQINYTAPVANAGTAQVISLPLNVITLTGSGAGTNGATISSYSWAKTSGPAGGTISLPLLNTTLVTGLVQGTYVFTLTVTDNHGLTSSSSVTITVNSLFNQIPAANAGPNTTITLPSNSIVLDASGSSDPDGYLTAYRWTQTSGPTGPVMSNRSAKTTSVTGFVAGTYTFVLQVTDNAGAVASSSVTVTVNPAPILSGRPGNQYPYADPGANINISLPTNSVVLDASGSTDPDGYITTYRWTQTTGPVGPVMATRDAMKTNVTGLVAGSYTFVLQVTDNSGATASANVIVNVNDAPSKSQGTNQYPIANPGPDIKITLPNNSVVLNGLSSYDTDGYLTGYRWTQTAGPVGPVMSDRDAGTTSVTGLLAGSYTFVLQVTDNGGLVGSSGLSITVSPGQSAGQPIGYIKQSVGLWQACDDASSGGRIPIYSNGIANGNLVYLDAGLTNVYNGGYNWFSFTPALGGAVTQAFCIFPDGVIHLLSACTSGGAPTSLPPATGTNNLLGYIKMSAGPYQACDDASSTGRIPIYGTTINNGNFVYTDAAMTQTYDGGWNWFSFTPVLGGQVTAAFAIYPIGSIGLLRNCSGSARMAASGLLQTADSAAVLPVRLNIYPNPVRTSATIELNSAENGPKTINIYNASGILTARYTWQTVKGNNTFAIKDISGLPGGLYIADIRDNNGKPVGKLKFVKL